MAKIPATTEQSTKQGGLRVLFAGGGTGGHICPAMAVAEALQEFDARAEVLFLGTGREVERKLLESAGYPYEVAAPVRMDRRLSRLPFLLAGAAKGMGKALRAVHRFRPHVVMGLGGYGQAPGVVSARVLGIPYVLFEPNKVPGRANRLLSAGAREVFIQWAGTEKGLRRPERAVQTGTPIRRQARVSQSKATAKARLGLPTDRKTLLIVGGSQGAKPLNDWAEGVFQHIRKARFSVVHLTGSKNDTKSLRDVYSRAGMPHVVMPFAEAMGELYAAADLVFCRAGGATLAEVTAAGLPAFMVPYPHAVDDHQTANACSLGAGGRVTYQQDLGMGTFDEIDECLTNPEILKRMAEFSKQLGFPDAARSVAARLRAVAGVTVSESKKAA